MPAASCRIMPARSISRCETISASFGVSRRIGRKIAGQAHCEHSELGADGARSESGSAGKHKAAGRSDSNATYTRRLSIRPVMSLEVVFVPRIPADAPIDR